ncbi:Oidioi.mRNA.OKI2018_I69.chr1.g3286.t1.cds [Oikopleura dioica]|uniref:Oidioi.mRNA.OKI2018_I69.chr1.g3286.t1.cds n=1 Tax=Oikopleura dioica TaxID=34765 RepID=A0ABN7STN1_OIKDI|nr:Oidioi.mRNA.OKI2018_I69.chr1.g3286.t1.cds [Oikopleura dioica]
MFKIAIVGAGPAGVSAAARLLKSAANKFQVNLFDRSLVPWGLLRTGVAPDHPEVKHTAQTWSNVADFPNFHFFGGVNVSDSNEKGIKSQFSLKELMECHDSVFLCNGAYNARRLKIPGADSERVINAQKLVGYYNADVMQNLSFNPSHLQGNVGIIGGGNVALDVARVLLEPELLQPTDVSKHFIEQAQKVDKISIFIRRGPFDLPCTTRELRELIHLPSVSRIIIKGLDEPLGESEKYKKLMKSRKVQERKTKRLLKLLAESETDQKAGSFGKGKTVEFNFFHTPENILDADNGGISVEFSHQGNSRRVDLSALVESLGYEKTPVSNFITDVDTKTGRASAFDRPIYLSGWALGGAKGVVGDSTESSRLAVQSLFDDIESGTLQALPRPDIVSLPHSNWENWRKIDEEELRRGQENGKQRDKILSISEMLKITE